MSKMEGIKYDRHEDAWRAVLNDSEMGGVGASWLKKDTIDFWRHHRIRELLQPLIKRNLHSSWLTVGDGRYGTDANYLLSCGIKHVHATDISDVLLKIGSQEGFINEYSAQNAESITFENNSFDYVYCKDALHHFPRPYIALNEMFRVAKKAVILIEPRDHKIDAPAFSILFSLIRKVLNRRDQSHGFESIGNYVYSISEREMEKYLLGMHYTQIAFNGCNDAYIAGVEFSSVNSPKIKDKLLFFKIKLKILTLNFLERFQMTRSGLLLCILFKNPPSNDELRSLRQGGWVVKELPQNPYL
jgi:ubiquinone/menaquinone biosynthesis C-methylase UbiE